MSKYTEQVIAGMDRILNDDTFQNKFKKASQISKKQPQKAFEKLASDLGCDNCYEEVQELLFDAPTELQDKIYSQIPSLAFKNESDDFWSSPKACEICNELRAYVGEPSIQEEQISLAFKYITDSLLKTSTALEAMGLKKSSIKTDMLLETILKEVAVTKLAEELKIEIDPAHKPIGSPSYGVGAPVNTKVNKQQSDKPSVQLDVPEVKKDVAEADDKKSVTPGKAFKDLDKKMKDADKQIANLGKDKQKADDSDQDDSCDADDAPGEAFNQLEGTLKDTDKQISELGKPREDQEAYDKIKQYMAQKYNPGQYPFGYAKTEPVTPFEKAMQAGKAKEQELAKKKQNSGVIDFTKEDVDVINPSNISFEEEVIKPTTASARLKRLQKIAGKY
jgi:hypothetical protein